MSSIQTQKIHFKTEHPKDRNIMVTDDVIFESIDKTFTFDLFVESFYQDKPSWIPKTISSDCSEKETVTNPTMENQ